MKVHKDNVDQVTWVSKRHHSQIILFGVTYPFKGGFTRPRLHSKGCYYEKLIVTNDLQSAISLIMPPLLPQQRADWLEAGGDSVTFAAEI